MQNFVGFLVMAIKWIVPNINRDLRDKIRREAYVTNEIIIRTELLKAKGVIGSCGNLEPNGDFYTQENANNLTESNSNTPLLRQRSSTLILNNTINTGDATDGNIVI